MTDQIQPEQASSGSRDTIAVEGRSAELAEVRSDDGDDVRELGMVRCEMGRAGQTTTRSPEVH